MTTAPTVYQIEEQDRLLLCLLLCRYDAQPLSIQEPKTSW